MLPPFAHYLSEEKRPMLNPNRRRLGGFVFAVALFPGSARAQATVHSLEELQRILKVRQTVVVTDENGRQVKGRVDKLSTALITVGGRTFTEAAVREIRLPDPLWNGMLIGAAVGTGLATWDYMIDPSEPGNAVVFTVAIGLGSAIGAGIDAFRTKGGKLIYASSRQTAAMPPLLERTRQGNTQSSFQSSASSFSSLVDCDTREPRFVRLVRPERHIFASRP
jgi:hypothetical protein